jgi:hypothetical protein
MNNHYAQGHVFFINILNVIMLNVVMLTVVAPLLKVAEVHMNLWPRQQHRFGYNLLFGEIS